MANFPSAGSVIPDKIQTDDLPKVLRNIYTQIARNIAAQDRVIANMFPGIQKDNDLKDMRVAHSLKGMAHNIAIKDRGLGVVGDVLFLTSAYEAEFGSAANPGSGGTTPAVGAGWTDDGTVVRLTTSTDQVGIGTASPGASFAVVNVNNVADVVALLKAKASQTGDLLQIRDSTTHLLAGFNKQGNLILGDINAPAVLSAIFMGGAGLASTGASGNTNSIISWGDNSAAISAPTCTADMIGPFGARIYTYKDPTGLFDSGYGQGASDCWALASDESITYSIWTGVMSGTTFLRVQWAGNGDQTNYGFVHSRKSTGAVSKGTPGFRFEETGAGTDYIAVQAPASVAAGSRLQTLMDLTGVIPVVGDDPPAVASKALGKVDLTGQTGAIGSTALTSSAPTGAIYVMDVVAVCTTASGSGAPTLDVTIAWTDVLGATTEKTINALSLAATGRAHGETRLELASGAINYSTTINAASGSPQYALYIRVMCLG